MTTMTTITFANNQKELNRKIELITLDHERLNPDSTVVISYLEPKLDNIHFLPHSTTQLLIGIQIIKKANEDL